MELVWGRSIGKRVFHVHVAGASGTPTTRQLLVRSLLRVVDFFPNWYLHASTAM